MQLLKEFRDFAVKGNIMELAVAVIIGGAFGKIVTSLVEDIIMPLVSRFTGGLDFSNMYYTFGNEQILSGMALGDAKKIGSVLAWGNFFTISINFIIIAFCIFVVLKIMNTAMPSKKTNSTQVGPTEIELLMEIRDLLKR